jgi:pyruvate/2-oxoglutarate dehydrogenase complex dihydrolipoamide acyltransferase (E2) component
VTGTGREGRLTAEDVRAASGERDAGSPRTASLGEDERLVASNATRRTIADRLSRQAAIPQVTTFRTVDCGELEAFRAALGVSPLPVVIAALCRTIERHALLNARWSADGTVISNRVHVGIATDTERGLLVPVLRDAQHRGIAAMRDEIRRLAEGARSDSLSIEDLSGATVAVSNTGSYGSEAGTPILSPGTGVTLAIGVIEPRALVVRDVVTARPACTLSCTFDHRVLDGAAVGRALTELVAILTDRDRLGDLPR